jgi:hypothetical protein
MQPKSAGGSCRASGDAHPPNIFAERCSASAQSSIFVVASRWELNLSTNSDHMDVTKAPAPRSIVERRHSA